MVSVIMGIVFFQLGEGGNFLGEAPNFSSIKKILKIPAFWILIALFSLAITSTLGIYNMLPLYLVTEHGMSQDWANSLVGTSRISTLGMAFLGGWATDRFGPKPIMIGVFFVTGILTLLIGMASTHWIAAVVFVQPGIVNNKHTGKQKYGHIVNHTHSFCFRGWHCTCSDWDYGG
jgi:NNP family nitrate/nitrite transporter-like MFS transporter